MRSLSTIPMHILTQTRPLMQFISFDLSPFFCIFNAFLKFTKTCFTNVLISFTFQSSFVIIALRYLNSVTFFKRVCCRFLFLYSYYRLQQTSFGIYRITYITFIDMEKAFDGVKYGTFCETIKNMSGVDYNGKRIIKTTMGNTWSDKNSRRKRSGNKNRESCQTRMLYITGIFK